MDRSRLEAFSDGVFAVAITLLALNLAVPGPGHGALLSLLGSHWPAFVAYVISFFTIGIIWVNHHALVRNIAVVDRTLLFLNLLLLLFVVAIPFATATMADYLTGGGQNAHVATALFAAVFEGMSLGFTLIFEWTLHEGRTHHPVPPRRPPGSAWAVLRRPDSLPDRHRRGLRQPAGLAGDRRPGRRLLHLRAHSVRPHRACRSRRARPWRARSIARLTPDQPRWRPTPC